MHEKVERAGKLERMYINKTFYLHGCLPQARNRNTEGSNSAFNRKVKIQDGRQRVKKEEARKKVLFVLNSFPLSRGDLTWDFHESNPYLSYNPH